MRVFMLIACLLLAPVQFSFASSLEDVAQENSSVTETGSGTEDSGIGQLFAPTGNDIVDGLNDGADVSAEVQGIDSFRQFVNNITAFIVQAIMVILTGGLVVISGLDLLYIVIPPFRMTLSGGQQGKAVMQQGGMGMGMNNGMGMGMNSGMGMSGGMGMGMSGGYGMGMHNGMGMGMNGQQMAGGKCYVSEAALNAVATAQNDASGKVGVAIKIWAKNTAVQLIAIPVISVLLLTGVIQKIGFGIGEVLANALANIKF